MLFEANNSNSAIRESLSFYIPKTKVPHFFCSYLQDQNLVNPHMEQANFLVLPFMYEIIYDYSEFRLQQLGLSTTDLIFLKEMATELDIASVETGKPLIVFFYRDPVIELPFRNAIIFRTSAYAPRASRNTFGLPAFLDHLDTSVDFLPLQKPEIPVVSFRGKSMPLKLSPQVWAREQANRFFNKLHIPLQVKNFAPEGYLLRRRAVLSCIRQNGKLQTDFVLNPKGGGKDYRDSYIQSFYQSHYMITAAGFGNYAYRLYEIMRAGRIPVFIDSNILLPCKDVIDWKNLLIWVPAKDVDRTADYILHFHHQIHPNDFEELQLRLRYAYEEFCTTKEFSKYLIGFLQQWQTTARAAISLS